MNPDFPDIARQFRFEGEFLDAEPIYSGHINDTYAARFRQSGGIVRRYLLQRINHHVFRSPEKVMSNISAITAHLQQKILDAGGDPERETVNLVATVDGDIVHQTSKGHWWRAALFIEGAQTHETAPTSEGVNQVAWAFGRFQGMLSDFPADQLNETIPDFHDTPKRYAALLEAVDNDVHNRAASVRSEIEFVEQRASELSILVALAEQDKLPLRVTHNDTKTNNVMIDDQTGCAICIIDLDTVMPGLSLYDFGDMVRSGASLAAEDEQDLSRVTFNLDRFEHLVMGYLAAAQELLTPLEIDCLPFSAKLMTLECGMRFLTDHLNGDRYFRIHRPNHNLDRCRNQFKLVVDMEEHFRHLVHLVEKHRPR
jgi:Ser/Thr protein kinase RdoA (MazF antagonist)